MNISKEDRVKKTIVMMMEKRDDFGCRKSHDTVLDMDLYTK